MRRNAKVVNEQNENTEYVRGNNMHNANVKDVRPALSQKGKGTILSGVGGEYEGERAGPSRDNIATPRTRV